jgi:hypothetical protein
MSNIYDLRDLVEEMEILREIKLKETLSQEDEDRLGHLEELDDQFDYGKGGMEEYASNICCSLIADYHFEDYAQDFAEDIGAIGDTYSWPVSCIDWKMAAEHLQMDYQSVTFEGRDYWIRG